MRHFTSHIVKVKPLNPALVISSILAFTSHIVKGKTGGKTNA